MQETKPNRNNESVEDLDKFKDELTNFESEIIKVIENINTGEINVQTTDKIIEFIQEEFDKFIGAQTDEGEENLNMYSTLDGFPRQLSDGILKLLYAEEQDVPESVDDELFDLFEELIKVIDSRLDFIYKHSDFKRRVFTTNPKDFPEFYMERYITITSFLNRSLVRLFKIIELPREVRKEIEVNINLFFMGLNQPSVDLGKSYLKLIQVLTQYLYSADNYTKETKEIIDRLFKRLNNFYVFLTKTKGKPN